MKDKEVKALLQEAYPITTSDSEKQFLKKYERRELRYGDVIALELKYMGPGSVIAGMLVLFVLGAAMLSRNTEILWYVSGMLPVIALVMTSALGKSERHGMQELEASARFSLRFIKSVRMFIMGIVTLALLTGCSFLLKDNSDFHVLTVFGLVGIPYMVNVWGNLVIARRWHEKENMIGCLAVTALTCLMPLLLESMSQLPAVKPFYFTAVLLLITAFAARESLLYIKESEESTWNSCWTV